MTRAEQDKVFALLRSYYPRARQLADRISLAAWGLVLENYTYADVKRSVVLYAANNKYFPDVADITGGLPTQAWTGGPTSDELQRMKSLLSDYDGKDNAV